MPHSSISLGPDRDGKVLVAEGGRVVHFGAAPDGFVEADSISCPQAKLRPGRINAHTHIYSGLAPLGMPPPAPKPENFIQILERVWWRLDRALDKASLRASARFYVAESLLAGTTTLIDHHESPNFIEGSLDVLADACQELGTRALLCFGATERNGGRQEAQRGLAECRRFIRSNQRPLVRGAVALHASFTVSDETIREAGELCRELDTVMHVHLAEDGADVVDAQKRGFAGPLERLLELEALPPGSLLAHGIHLTPEQVRLAAERGLWFLHNPRSNRGNEVGYAKNLAESSRVALGTDGYPARMDDEAVALFEEAAAHNQTADEVRPRIEAGYDLEAELFDASFSPLTPGAMADVIAVEDNRVAHVVVDGHSVVSDGRLLNADVDEIRAAAQNQAASLWDRMAALE